MTEDTTSGREERVTDLAKRFFDALENADVDALETIYAKDATLWTSTTQRASAAREVAAFLPVLARRMPDRRYVDRRVTEFDGGFIQRHRLTGTNREGAQVAVECCAMVFVENWKVTRVEEYLDSRQLAAVMGS